MAKIGPKEAQRRALRETASKMTQSGVMLLAPSYAAILHKVANEPRRGRPALKLSPAQRAERKRAQTLKRVQKLREKSKK